VWVVITKYHTPQVRPIRSSLGKGIATKWEELVSAMQRFGLPEREAVFYLSLLRRGRATARELTRDAHVDRVFGYRILESMRGRGIVQVTAERPRRYVPTSPDLLFQRALQDRRQALATDTQLAQELSTLLPGLSAEGEDSAPRFQVLTGSATIYTFLAEMVARASEEVNVVITHRALRSSVRYGLPRHVGTFLERGGRFRMIVESDPRVRGLLDRFAQVTRRFPNAAVGQLFPQPARITLVDRAEALVFLVPEARPGAVEEIAVWTNNKEFVHGQQLYFDSCWDRAGSMSRKRPRPPPIRARRSVAASA
jgi:sugar-specific transcriptional regulator TrmB